jgi:cytochrome b
MKRRVVYDLPLRVFHWLFAGLFVMAFVIAKFIEDKSSLFSWHMIAGLTLGFLILCRLIWGVIGTQHAKFSDFTLSFKSLREYFSEILSKNPRKWVGHNPASSWAAVLMMLCGVGLVTTGVLMTSSSKKEWFEDVHPILAYAFLTLAVLHIAGVILHTLQHRELIGLSMWDGKKTGVSDSEEIRDTQKFVGILLGLAVVLFGFYLNKNYDQRTGKLEVFGLTLQLSENQNDKTHSHQDDND